MFHSNLAPLSSSSEWSLVHQQLLDLRVQGGCFCAAGLCLPRSNPFGKADPEWTSDSKLVASYVFPAQEMSLLTLKSQEQLGLNLYVEVAQRCYTRNISLQPNKFES